MPVGRSKPERTCVGCRKRAAQSELVRLTALFSGSDAAEVAVVVDLRGRLGGRGAYLHRDLRCVDLAEKRRAVARALRIAGPVEHDPVRRLFAEPELAIE